MACRLAGKAKPPQTEDRVECGWSGWWKNWLGGEAFPTMVVGGHIC